MARVCRTLKVCFMFSIAFQFVILFLVHLQIATSTKPIPPWPVKDIEDKTLEVGQWTMDQAEDLIFGPVDEGKARQATAQADSIIPNLISKSDWFTAEGHGLLEANMYQLKVDIGNYTFIPGGHWKPRNCVPRWKVAIIIPYRNRSYHLPVLLRHLVPMLQRQRLEFGVFTINQENDLMFNRAMLMNIGFLESLRFASWHCFVFHDVDILPMSDLNYYGCKNMPRHFMTGSSQWNYTLLYKQLFGGVTGFRRRDVLKMNGFPNRYWGWGGEDDDIYKRALVSRLSLALRPTGADRHIGFYKTIDHHHQSSSQNLERRSLLNDTFKLLKHDGLNNLKYPAPRIEIHPLYINISVEIFKL